MIRLTVLYGKPTDPEAFLSYYESTHAPLASKIPDLARFTWGKCLPGADGGDPPYFLIAELVWESMEAMGSAMAGAEGSAAAADMANFSTGSMSTILSEVH